MLPPYTLFDWKKTIHLVRGLPGEGKSTLALKLVNGNKDQVVENDDYWMLPVTSPGAVSMEYKYERAMTHLAAFACCAEAFRRLRIYDTIAVANTFVRREFIYPWIEEARKLGVVVKLHRPTTPWVGDVDKCVNTNVHNVPYGTVLKMSDTWEDMTQEEVDVLLGIYKR